MATFTTLGRELVKSKLPDKYKQYADRPLDKGALTKLTTELAKEDPDAYIDILQDLNDLGEGVVSYYGGEAALPYDELVLAPEIASLNKKLRARQDAILDDPALSNAEKEQKLLELGNKSSKLVQSTVYDSNNARRTALASQINSGSRGNKSQLQQLQFGNLMMVDALNRQMPYIMMDPYIGGITPMSAWVSASSGRKGNVDVQFATGKSGYLSKQLGATTHDNIISEEDCGTTDTGVPYPADSAQNVGAVLLRPWKRYPAGTVVTERMVASADPGDEMVLRSPMTCKSRQGICAKCNGLNENGRFPGIGEYVSLNAAKALSEPLTQAGLGCITYDTLVRMGDWSIKRAGDIVVGDMVMGCDIKGNASPAKVTHVFDNGIQPVYRTTLKSDKGAEVYIDTTASHRMLGHPTVTTGGGAYPFALVVMSGEGYVLGTDQLCSGSPGTRHKLQRTGMSHIGDLPVMDIEVDNEDHLYLFANGAISHNSKHVGGVGGGKNEDPEGPDQPSGLAAVAQFLNAPSTFKGGAVLSEVDGTVGTIRPASQGGYYISVGTSNMYSPAARTILVKPGDKVEAGDRLTNGVPNPMEVVQYKGLGRGRTYFVDQLAKILDKAGAGTHRRNLEALARSMLNKVSITDYDGYADGLPGDVTNYSAAAADYKPRNSAVELLASEAVGKYLERPVLDYTIGSRVTPSMASRLQKFGMDKILVDASPPPFEDKFVRPFETMRSAPNWLPRLGGERLRDALFTAAQTGMTDQYDAPSYINKIVTNPLDPNLE
jgi:hypothetical protein